jgi:hypothetical protein
MVKIKPTLTKYCLALGEDNENSLTPSTTVSRPFLIVTLSRILNSIFPKYCIRKSMRMHAIYSLQRINVGHMYNIILWRTSFLTSPMRWRPSGKASVHTSVFDSNKKLPRESVIGMYVLATLQLQLRLAPII